MSKPSKHSQSILGLLAFAMVAVIISGCVTNAKFTDERFHNWWNYYEQGREHEQKGEYVQAMEDFERCLGWGGGLFADYSAVLTADYCTFVYCGDVEPGNPDPFTKSGTAGAAGVNHSSTLNLNDCTIFGSYADYGGAAIDATRRGFVCGGSAESSKRT